MEIIYIGDRSVGKTHLAVELLNSKKSKHIRGSLIDRSYEDLTYTLIGQDGKALATKVDRVYDQEIEIQANLPAGSAEVHVDWLDCAGERFNPSWAKNNPDQWEQFLREKIRPSEGILLILPPYREMLSSSNPQRDDYSTKKQWCRRFQRWVNLFSEECPNVAHIIICLNKVDLIENFDLEHEESILKYDPNDQNFNWQKCHNHVVKKYFRPVIEELKQLNQNRRSSAVRCFITTIHNRNLLELPWIYLASFLSI